MTELALFGGEATLQQPMPPFNRIGDAEMHEVEQVMRSGELSGFVGELCDAFNGGPTIRKLEAAWIEKFCCKRAITVNSNTSGLIAAMGAVGISPGDEVIVPPYTMSATAMAPLIYGGIPVFVDIEPDYFCLDPALVRQAITPRTRAILVVNLFGHPAMLSELREIADSHGIFLIEDNAQAPLAMENGRYAGTIGHIGVFSLNRHKHIQTGEGGVCVTDDDALALRLSLIRNHGENLADPLELKDLTNLVGFNFRMTELSAAVGIAQLRRADEIIDERVALAERLTTGLSGLDGIAPPKVRADCSHVYYVWVARYDARVTGVSRKLFSEALAAEGFVNGTGYVKPLYKLPQFRKRIAFGGSGYPFNLTNQAYATGQNPVCERMYEEEILEFFICSFDPDDQQQNQLIDAFHKVYENIDGLAAHENRQAEE
jgi:perosamine synthetase